MAEEVNRQSVLAKAQRQADKALRANHQDEWNEHMKAATAEAGIDWKPRASAEEKAEKQLADLLAKHPHLRDRVGEIA